MSTWVPDLGTFVLNRSVNWFEAEITWLDRPARLDIDRETGGAVVLSGSEKAYFGANIHTILADSFFLNYTIGESARVFLQKSMDRLRRNGERADELPDGEKQFVETMRVFVPHIGDELIRSAFEIVLRAFPENEVAGQ